MIQHLDVASSIQMHIISNYVSKLKTNEKLCRSQFAYRLFSFHKFWISVSTVFESLGRKKVGGKHYYMSFVHSWEVKSNLTLLCSFDKANHGFQIAPFSYFLCHFHRKQYETCVLTELSLVGTLDIFWDMGKKVPAVFCSHCSQRENWTQYK